GLRLNRISDQLARIERDGHVQIESLALFIRYMLTVNAPLAEEDEVSRAIGRDRFQAFIARVAQQLASGRRSFAAEEER
ncbi:MAG TPA: CopG family transcriptional regulator, partial [Allosphingosinicella sp.]|nr:CopG family transcriptional regulator [Allosphingosinicella sp.]